MCSPPYPPSPRRLLARRTEGGISLRRVCGVFSGVVSQVNNSISLVQDALNTPSRNDTISYTIGQALKTPPREKKTPSCCTITLRSRIASLLLGNNSKSVHLVRSKINFSISLPNYSVLRPHLMYGLPPGRARRLCSKTYHNSKGAATGESK